MTRTPILAGLLLVAFILVTGRAGLPHNWLNRHFDSVVSIQMPSRAAHMDKFSADINQEIEAVPATDATSLPDGEKRLVDQGLTVYGFRARCATSHNETETDRRFRGKVALGLGLKRVLDGCVDRNHSCLVLEDDVVVSPRRAEFAQQLDHAVSGAMAALKAHDPQWDVVFLGNCFSHCSDESWVAQTVGLRTAVGTRCLHAFGVSKKGAEVIARGLVPVSEVVDELIARLIQSELRGYRISPEVFGQHRGMGSLIHVGEMNKLGYDECNLQFEDEKRNVMPLIWMAGITLSAILLGTACVIFIM